MSTRRGFTIIEVTLVLAITALLVTGIMTGTANSIARQRYNDAVNDTVSFLRRAYSEVINVQNTRTDDISSLYCSVTTAFTADGVALDPDVANPESAGRTNCAIYGRLLTFGEAVDGTLSDKIHSYDVVGRIYSPDDYADPDEFSDSDRATDANIAVLKNRIGANAVTFSTVDTECRLAAAGNSSAYTPNWGVRLEAASPDHIPFRGALFIFRSPLSGTINTNYIEFSNTDANSNLPINIQKAIASYAPTSGSCTKNSISSSSDLRDQFLQAILSSDKLVAGSYNSDQDFTICLNSDDLAHQNGLRRGIRIHQNGRNSTAVELLNTDVLQNGGDNPCR